MSLEPPPRDASGNVINHDHQGISPDDGVIRRISENQLITDKDGVRRISSKAFQPSSGPFGGMSVDLEASILLAGLDPKKHVTSPHWLASVRFRAGDIRAEGFQVGYDPIPDNPHHGEVWGNFTKAKKRHLQEICEWFVPLPDVLVKPC